MVVQCCVSAEQCLTTDTHTDWFLPSFTTLAALFSISSRLKILQCGSSSRLDALTTHLSSSVGYQCLSKCCWGLLIWRISYLTTVHQVTCHHTSPSSLMYLVDRRSRWIPPTVWLCRHCLTIVSKGVFPVSDVVWNSLSSDISSAVCTVTVGLSVLSLMPRETHSFNTYWCVPCNNLLFGPLWIIPVMMMVMVVMMMMTTMMMMDTSCMFVLKLTTQVLFSFFS